MSTGLGISKPWQSATPNVIQSIPAQLGVYEIATTDGEILEIGYAGGAEPFGMRSALERATLVADGACFRFEFTHAYLTRWQELLMVYEAAHARLPTRNSGMENLIGRLTPDGARDTKQPDHNHESSDDPWI